VISGKHKLPAFSAVLERRGVSWEETAFIGDDLIDIPLMKRVALPAAVANAVAEVKSCARFVTGAAGGHGAVREFAEALLRSRGCWDTTVSGYVTERDGHAGN
jgi:3-deoxy-D-manno-octulosonate 8-phosphate phosphatase (KDO 8-P phosphatase)